MWLYIIFFKEVIDSSKIKIIKYVTIFIISFFRILKVRRLNSLVPQGLTFLNSQMHVVLFQQITPPGERFIALRFPLESFKFYIQNFVFHLSAFKVMYSVYINCFELNSPHVNWNLSSVYPFLFKGLLFQGRVVPSTVIDKYCELRI